MRIKTHKIEAGHYEVWDGTEVLGSVELYKGFDPYPWWWFAGSTPHAVSASCQTKKQAVAELIEYLTKETQ
jgi:hypothetical protein